MLAKKTLSFNLKSVLVRPLFESDAMKNKVLIGSYRDLGMNKSTLWYPKRRFEEKDSVRIYNKTKQYFL